MAAAARLVLAESLTPIERRDGRRRLVLRVSLARPSRFQPTTGVKRMSARQNVAVGRAVVHLETHGARGPARIVLVFWYLTVRNAAW